MLLRIIRRAAVRTPAVRRAPLSSYRGLIAPSLRFNSTAAATAPAEDAAPPARNPLNELKQRLSPHIFSSLVATPFNFTKLSPVQDAVFEHIDALTDPVARSTKLAAQSPDKARKPTDLLVKAKTGTGKTIGFLVPAMEARLKDLAQLDPEARREVGRSSVGTLILSPTRELATQIATEAVKLSHNMRDCGVQLFVGGASKNVQRNQFARGRRDFLVATPGRMLDMLQSEPAIADAVSQAKLLVLDEADTLLDMGFKDEIDSIIKYLPPKGDRQTFLFSATVSREIREIARSSMRKEHLFINTVSDNESSVHDHVPQYVSVLRNAEDQIPHILKLIAQDALANPAGSKIVLFFPTTRLTQLFGVILQQARNALPFGRDTRILEIHSKKTQSSRDNTSDMFRQAKGGQTILVTSDVSARGVDYPGVTRVIQIGVPTSRDVYVHRVGRTGRAGKAGRGDLVLLPWEASYYTNKLQDIPLKRLDPSTVDEDFTDLVAKFDHAKPTATREVNPKFSTYRNARPQPPNPVLPATGRITATTIEQYFETQIKDSIDPMVIEETMLSMLGYYASKVADMPAVSKSEVLQGLKNWATQSCGLANEPMISSSFLARTGFNSGPSISRGRSRFGAGVGRFEPFGQNFGNRERGPSNRSRPAWGAPEERPSRSFGARGDFGGRDSAGGFGARDSAGGFGARASAGGFGARDRGYGAKEPGFSPRRDQNRRDPPWSGRGRTSRY